MTEAIQQAPMPEQMKQVLLNDLPSFLEQVDEATQKIYNPHAVWLESLQFADYVSQMAKHIEQGTCEDTDCELKTLAQLIFMAENWKELAENALEVLDKSELVFKHGS